MEEKKMTSKEMLNELVAKHYEGALQAKAEGRPVVWASIRPVVPVAITLLRERMAL